MAAAAAKVLNAIELKEYLRSFLKNRCLASNNTSTSCGMATLIIEALDEASQEDNINYSKPKSAVYNTTKAEIMNKIRMYHRDDRVYIVPSEDVTDPIRWIVRMNFFYDDDFKNLTKSTILYILTEINAHKPITFPPLIEFEARMRRLLLRSESEDCEKNKKIIDENPIHQVQYNQVVKELDDLDRMKYPGVKWNNEDEEFDFSDVQLPSEETRINETCISTNAKKKMSKSSHVESCKRILTKRRHYDKVFGKGKCSNPLQAFQVDAIVAKKEGWMKRLISNPSSIPAIFRLKRLLSANKQQHQPRLQQSPKSPSLKQSPKSPSLKQSLKSPSLQPSPKSLSPKSLSPNSPSPNSPSPSSTPRTVKTRSSPGQTSSTLKVRPPLTIRQKPKSTNIDDHFNELPKNNKFRFQMDNMWYTVVVHSNYAELTSNYDGQKLKIYKPSSYHFWQFKLKERSSSIFSQISKQYRTMIIQSNNNSTF